MSSKNKVNLMGWFGADPELKKINGSNGDFSVCEIRLSTKYVYKDASQNRQEKTTWHNLKFWGKNAENISQWAKKGSHVDVEGTLQYDEWEDDQKVKKIKAYVDVKEFRLLDKKSERQEE